MYRLSEKIFEILDDILCRLYVVKYKNFSMPDESEISVEDVSKDRKCGSSFDKGMAPC